MSDQVKVAFPGLGLDLGTFDSVAFYIGDRAVMWYGVIIACGMLLAIAYAAYRCKQHQIKIDDLIDIAIFTIFFGIIGARLYYVSLNLDKFNSFAEILGFGKNGLAGLAILGGVAFGAITIVVVCLIKKISWRQLFDCVAPAVMLAQAIGRWGNFMNGEAYGEIVSEGHPLYFLRMGLSSSNTTEFGTFDMVYVHPCFLYESVWNVIGFILINIFYKKKKFDGQIALYYAIWYGFGRMFIEGLRTDSMYFGDTGIRSNQLLAFLICAVGTALLIMGLIYVKNHPDSKLAKVGANFDAPKSEKKSKMFFKKAEKLEESVEENEESPEQDGEDN